MSNTIATLTPILSIGGASLVYTCTLCSTAWLAVRGRTPRIRRDARLVLSLLLKSKKR
jgi:hypothetical protein